MRRDAIQGLKHRQRATCNYMMPNGGEHINCCRWTWKIRYLFSYTCYEKYCVILPVYLKMYKISLHFFADGKCYLCLKYAPMLEKCGNHNPGVYKRGMQIISQFPLIGFCKYAYVLAKSITAVSCSCVSALPSVKLELRN